MRYKRCLKCKNNTFFIDSKGVAMCVECHELLEEDLPVTNCPLKKYPSKEYPNPLEKKE